MQRQRWRQTSCWDAPFWVEARRRPRARVSGRMTARSCVFASEASRPGHHSGPTASRERRHLDVPSPQARAIDTQVGAQAQISPGPVPPARYMPAERRRSTGEPHRRRLPTAASRGGGRFAPGKDLNCAFRARPGRDFFGWAVTNLSPTNAAIGLGWPWIAVGGLP